MESKSCVWSTGNDESIATLCWHSLAFTSLDLKAIVFCLFILVCHEIALSSPLNELCTRYGLPSLIPVAGAAAASLCPPTEGGLRMGQPVTLMPASVAAQKPSSSSGSAASWALTENLCREVTHDRSPRAVFCPIASPSLSLCAAWCTEGSRMSG